MIVEPELRQYILILWQRRWLIALTTVLAAVAAFVVSRAQTPTYRATVTLEVQQGSDPAESAYTAQRDAAVVAATYVLQVPAKPVLAEVITRLDLAMDVDDVADMVSATQVRDTAMIEIGAESPDPALAQALASTTAEVFIEQKTAQEQERYQASLRELEAQVAALEARIQETRSTIAAMGDQQDLSSAGRAERARLETQLTTDQTRLTVLLQSTEQFRLAMTRSGNYLTIFAPAELPEEPVSPQPLRNTALAAVVGAMIGVGAVFLLDYLDDSVHDPQEVERLLGINALGGIPEMEDELDARSLIVAQQPLHLVSEAFRNLRTSIQFADLDRDIRTLMVTSPLPSEGKSFVAANLAAVLAQGGRKVVLVEGDLRHPTVHRTVRVEKEPGLSDALMMLSEAGEEAWRNDKLQELLRPVPEVDGLMQVLTSGASVPNPAEILGSGVFQRLLEWLRDDADVVIVDMPPLLSVTDAAVVATLVDAVVMVAEAGETRLGALYQAYERLEDVGARLLGVAVNRLSPRSGSYYHYYYDHSYAYGDGAGGDSHDRPAAKRGPLASLLGRPRPSRRTPDAKPNSNQGGRQ